MIHLDKPDYLQIGNDRQKQAFIVLQELELFNQLSIYDPVLTGTIPLGIDIATSDLDIICQVGCSEFDQFTHEVVNLYGDCTDFQLDGEDPYDRMLQLYDYSDIKLLEMMNLSKSNEGSN
ncbi:DUF4269 domain-containing protein [Brevibacterium sp. JNUCC-42]|nr:DUF4269 domain-containing protein [Brevibacterium sp. JNUCC-42]